MIRDTVLFKNKYLTNPTITTANSIIQSGNDLARALENNITQTNYSKKAIKQFMELFKM